MALSEKDFPNRNGSDGLWSEGGDVDGGDPAGRKICDMFQATGMRMDERGYKPNVELDKFGNPVKKSIWARIIGAIHP